MVRVYDVAVVGAGIIGAAIAYECATRGARVALVDRDQPGAHASATAAGMLVPCSEADEAGPFLDFAERSLAEWPDFARRVRDDSGIDPGLDICGLLRVALDGEGVEEVQSRLRWQQTAGVADGRRVDAGEAREVEPALGEDVRGAAWYASEGHVNARQAVRALVAAAQARGATVQCGGGEMPSAGGIVLAAGAWLGELAPLPITPVFGQIAVLHGIGAPPRRIVYAGRHGYVVAKRDGTLLAGATAEDRGFDTTPDAQTTRRLHHQAARLIPAAANATTVETRTGLRPRTPDGLPVLGPLPASDGGRVLVAGGHYRNGVLLAPATALGIAGMLLDGTTPEGWDAFDPRRFG